MAHEKRIARGARWLDKHNPGWEDRVSSSALNPYSDRDCVLGQVRGDFSEFMDPRYLTGWINKISKQKLQTALTLAWLGTWLGVRFATSHGFIMLRESDPEWCEAWGHEIAVRRDRKKNELTDSQRRDQLLAKVPLYFPAEWDKVPTPS